jgi:hypothetical protein
MRTSTSLPAPRGPATESLPKQLRLRYPRGRCGKTRNWRKSHPRGLGYQLGSGGFGRVGCGDTPARDRQTARWPRSATGLSRKSDFEELPSTSPTTTVGTGNRSSSPIGRTSASSLPEAGAKAAAARAAWDAGRSWNSAAKECSLHISRNEGGSSATLNSRGLVLSAAARARRADTRAPPPRLGSGPKAWRGCARCACRLS